MLRIVSLIVFTPYFISRHFAADFAAFTDNLTTELRRRQINRQNIVIKSRGVVLWGAPISRLSEIVFVFAGRSKKALERLNSSYISHLL